jgi:transcriptional/translational regulatory protein YebC/TACO1
MAAAGSVSWLFDRRGVIAIEELPEDADRDEIQMSLIELGADEIDDQGDIIEAYCDPAKLIAISEGIRKLGISPSRAETTMLPKNTVKVEGHAAEKVLKLVDALDDNEDVQEVFANFDIPDEVLEQFAKSE